ncbi:MAG: MBL fold metallo-hydrolase [Pseudomonadota bacterium]
MFEAVTAVCLGVQAEHCRDSLIPGYEAASLAECEAKLRETPVDKARCAEVGAALAVVETAPGLFAHLGQIAEPNPTNRGDVSNMGFVIGEESVAVIDTGSAAWIGEALWRAIRAETDLPISHVVLTHMHQRRHPQPLRRQSYARAL